MINLILFGSFFVMLLLNIPIAVSLGMSSIFALLFSSSPLTVVPTNVYSGMAKFLLLAIPFFVLSERGEEAHYEGHHGQGGHLQPSGGVC